MNTINLYQQTQPTLTMAEYFSGTVKGCGMVQKNSGAVRRRFTVTMIGKWQGTQGTLDEAFVYDDGEQQHRQWQITQTDAHHFTATAADVVGTAHGEQFGAAIHMVYTLQIPYEGRTVAVTMDDWLYRINEQVVLNNATIKKFYIPLGRVTASFARELPR